MLFACILLAIPPANTCHAALSATDLAVIVNANDPLSVAIGDYYAKARQLPPENVITVSFPAGKDVLATDTFQRVYMEVGKRTPPHVQAYALTWAAPVRVNCMSIGAAFTFGYATRHCAKGCRATAPNPYYDSASRRPYTDYAVRPTMMIAARTLENARILIDRGILSDRTNPTGSAYFVVTKDRARNTRESRYHVARQRFNHRLPATIVRAQGLADKFDVMFYFTGAVRVPHLDTLGFLPGAMADHLTSAGGKLLNSPQMSAMKWLEAGATGSYGTVVEPCNFPQKFPDPVVAMAHYLEGETLIEAYWKSVMWPGQGIFIGEPLARPFAEISPRAASQ